jgi:hypothetical protein
MWKMKGYPVSDGYMGMMPDGIYCLFATEQDYKEFIDDDSEYKED